MDKVAIGAKLRSLRGKTTQKEVAESIGVLPSSYSMYENGQRTPSDETKLKLAKYYGTTVQAIFFD